METCVSKIEKIRYPISEEMKKFEQFFKFYMKSKVPILDGITNYIIRCNGKQMRPMFVFLSAKLSGEITPSTYVAASLIELLHTASLIHDDVVDESNERRGSLSINALWKSKIAVLVGDFLLSKAVLTAVDNEEYGLLKIVSSAIREMVEGELLQIQKSRTLNITQEEYFEIIRKKTAVLIAACTSSGTRSVCDDKEVISKMHLFGENVGIAFQIKDDIFDFQQDGKTGKPAGIDIKEKKLTLPLIYSLENTSKSDKRNILRMIDKHNKKSKTIKEVIDFVTQNKGIEYACEKMAEYKNKALKILSEFSGNAAKTSLIELVNYSTIRER